MRSFTSDRFKKILAKGLRQFDSSNRFRILFKGKVPVGLIECHNLSPAEKGLKPHNAVVSLNESLSWGDTSALPLVTFPEWEDITGGTPPVVRDVWGDSDTWGNSDQWGEPF